MAEPTEVMLQADGKIDLRMLAADRLRPVAGIETELGLVEMNEERMHAGLQSAFERAVALLAWAWDDKDVTGADLANQLTVNPQTHATVQNHDDLEALVVHDHLLVACDEGDAVLHLTQRGLQLVDGVKRFAHE
jgi:hypothetical protein